MLYFCIQLPPCSIISYLILLALKYQFPQRDQYSFIWPHFNSKKEKWGMGETD